MVVKTIEVKATPVECKVKNQHLQMDFVNDWGDCSEMAN